jgi:PPOX class probable F420-dependent enzyme
MTRLNKEEREKFLTQPRLAHLVTLRSTGTPHVAPVWFLWDGKHGEKGRVWVMAGGDTVKVRNIKSNPTVALSIATPERPLSYISLEGRAEVTSEGLDDVVERMCVLYDGPDKGVEFAKELLGQERMVLLNITIDKIMSWEDDG